MEPQLQHQSFQYSGLIFFIIDWFDLLAVQWILRSLFLSWTFACDIRRVFPCGSAGKESTCNVGDLGSVSGLEDPLEKGKATHSNILAWRIPWTDCIAHGVTKSQTRLSNFRLGES